MIKTRSIREFIYVDVPKLYSLYSQIFGGVTDRVIEERINQLITSDTQRSVLRQATTESQGMESLRRIESSILHDHMYNRLEAELGPTLVNAADVKLDDIVKTYAQNPTIKVSGRSEVEDYQRISVFFEKFNSLGEAIAYAGLISSPEFQQIKETLHKELEEATGKTRRQEFERKIKELTDPKLVKRVADERGLGSDPQMLKNLKFMGDLFNPNGYDIVITPKDKPNVHFRGVLDKVWLRNDPQLIRSLYGGQSESPWSMVGIVTHLPGTYIALNDAKEQAQPSDIQNNIKQDDDNPMMLDAYRNMFRTARVFERMFLESKSDIEIVISPIAIYREFQVQIKSKVQKKNAQPLHDG
jgi:hypothetical protein